VARAPTLQPNGEEDSLPWSSKTPTLELGERLPWSYPGATLELENAYPGATLELEKRLPWSYPGAGKRLPWSGSRVGPPLDLAGFPCDSSSSSRSSRSSPKAPGSPNNPPPPAYPGAPLGPSPGPLRGLRTDGRPGPPDLGSWSSSYFPQKQFVWEICQIDSRPRAGGEGTRQRGDRLPWSAYPGAGDRPTLHLLAEGRSKKQPTKTKHTRKPLRVPPGLFAAGEASIGEIEAKYGLPSADRNNKATLLLTGPFRTAKSSAKDLTPLVLKLQYAKYRGPLRGPRRNRLLRH
jgi:hypothetical protein